MTSPTEKKDVCVFFCRRFSWVIVPLLFAIDDWFIFQMLSYQFFVLMNKFFIMFCFVYKKYKQMLLFRYFLFFINLPIPTILEISILLETYEPSRIPSRPHKSILLGKLLFCTLYGGGGIHSENVTPSYDHFFSISIEN